MTNNFSVTKNMGNKLEKENREIKQKSTPKPSPSVITVQHAREPPNIPTGDRNKRIVGQLLEENDIDSWQILNTATEVSSNHRPYRYISSDTVHQKTKENIGTSPTIKPPLAGAFKASIEEVNSELDKAKAANYCNAKTFESKPRSASIISATSRQISHSQTLEKSNGVLAKRAEQQSSQVSFGRTSEDHDLQALFGYKNTENQETGEISRTSLKDKNQESNSFYTAESSVSSTLKCRLQCDQNDFPDGPRGIKVSQNTRVESKVKQVKSGEIKAKDRAVYSQNNLEVTRANNSNFASDTIRGISRDVLEEHKYEGDSYNGAKPKVVRKLSSVHMQTKPISSDTTDEKTQGKCIERIVSNPTISVTVASKANIEECKPELGKTKTARDFHPITPESKPQPVSIKPTMSGQVFHSQTLEKSNRVLAKRSEQQSSHVSFGWTSEDHDSQALFGSTTKGNQAKGDGTTISLEDKQKSNSFYTANNSDSSTVKSGQFSVDRTESSKFASHMIPKIASTEVQLQKDNKDTYNGAKPKVKQTDNLMDLNVQHTSPVSHHDTIMNISNSDTELQNDVEETLPSESSTPQEPKTGIVITLKGTFGFIKPDQSYPEICSKSVHFKMKVAPKGIAEKQHVCFLLSEQCTRERPSAKSVWFCLDDSTNTPADTKQTKCNAPIQVKPENEFESQVTQRQIPRKTSYTGKIIRVIPGNEKLKKPGFGFIKPSELLSDDYARNDIHFIVDHVESAGLKLIAGDTIKFVLGCKNKQKPTAFQPKLIHCHARPSSVIVKYIKDILMKLNNHQKAEQSFTTKDMCGLLTCMPVWHCLADTQNISEEGLTLFMKLVLTLEEKSKSFQGNFKLVVKEISKSCFFNPKTGKLKHFIEMLLLEQGDVNVPHIFRNFVLVILKHIPQMARPLLRILKPLVSTRDTCVENLLYELLILTSKAQGLCEEYMVWEEMPLVPGDDEIFQEFESKDLLAAKPKGPYSSVDEYFEVYFRLLREDCFSGLKKGVQGLLKGNLDPRDMSVFQCIALCGIHLSEFECALSIAIKVKPLNRKKNWNSANNLMFGNLVCITTTGNFRNNIWGTVMSRELLQSKDIVFIQLCSSGNSLGSSKIISLLDASKDQAILVESPTYYRAFEPVLNSLQKMKPDQIPFQEELVKVQNSLPATIFREDEQEHGMSEFQYERQITPLELLKPTDLQGLDESQAKALEHALTKRLAIIQGPPGTGKTYIGVKVIEVLESIKELIKLPIVVLTYKNHALDEFLKDLLKLFPEKVARIGGRSKDEVLQRCNLTEIKRQQRMPKYQYEILKEYKTEIESLKCQIEDELQHLHASQELSISSLMKKLSHSQMQQVLLGCDWGKTDIPSLQQTDIEGFTVKQSKKKGKFKTITNTEAKELISSLNQDVASFLESNEAKESELGKHFNIMAEAALKQWVPLRSKFEEIMGSSSFDLSSLNVEGKSTGNNEESDDKDAEEEEKERLASQAQHQQKGKSVIDEMFFLQVSQQPKWMPHLHPNSMALIKDAPLLFYTNIVNPWELSARDRVIYIQALLQESFAEKERHFEFLLAEYEEAVTGKKEIEDSFKIDILKQMNVVGMTITGASIHNQILSALKPSVVIVEEAGEVLEPQILPVLGDWVKHLILIGDHKQLRPSVESYTLVKQYHFDISMMERMINNNIDYKSLQMQNRMREEFADLLLDIYPNLKSNTSRVKNNISPSCVAKSMYFWTHSNPEIAERSYKNEAEAQRAIKLALFFIQQEYKPSQITILGAYQGQVSLLRKMMRKAEGEHKSVFEKHKNFTGQEKVDEKETSSPDNHDSDDKDEQEERVQIQTIDNYQGDENDIVIVSLVRSNNRGRVGFLNTLNRRCVAQSRARCGMYFVGDKHTLGSSVYWSVLIKRLEAKGCVGKNLTLKCPRHPAVTISAQTADDITLGSFCKADCSMKMSCQIHFCKKLCQPSHAHTPCLEIVDFVFKNCSHTGKRKCFEKESDKLCRKEVQIVFNSCGHTGMKPCFKSVDEIKCQQQCTKILSCKHMCTMKCSEPCSTDSCEMCEQIRKEKEEIERKIKEEERKIIQEEVCKEIEYLQSREDKMDRFELQPYGETASEYNDVEDKVKKYIQIGHKWFPVIKKIEKVENPPLRLKWLQYKKKMVDPTYEALKFHGTSAEAVDVIVEKGFKMPKSSNQMYGPGIYFATDSSKSAQEMYTKGSNMLLLCNVLLGKTYTVDSAQKDMTLKRLRNLGYDSLYAVRDSRKSGGVLYDEYVVFDVRQALPQYVVHYTRVDIDDTMGRTQSLEAIALASQQMKKYTVVPKREIKMDDQLDIHLRIAEAQFQRLLNSQRYAGAVTQIKSLDYYINPPLVAKFLAKSKEFAQKFGKAKEAGYIFGFHGTKEENIASIVKENFSLAHLAKNTGDKGFYGAGIYFSEFPSVSLGYGKSILLCKVLPGKSFDVKQQMLGAPLERGYDSHRVNKDAEGRGHELVIFNPDQILPCYVINL